MGTWDGVWGWGLEVGKVAPVNPKERKYSFPSVFGPIDIVLAYLD